MYILPIFKKILNLNWKKVTILGIYEEQKKIIFKIRGKYGNVNCHCCGLNTNKRKDKKLHIQKQHIKHMPYGGDKIIELELHKRHFRCTNCQKDFYETFHFESIFGYYTTHFEKYIQWNWGFISGNKLSELYQTSNSVIYSILERIDINLLNERGMKLIETLEEIYLGVDEHSFSGHDMVLVITDLKSKNILAVLDGITKEKLEAWIWSIPLKYHAKIKGFSTDMNKGYANSLMKIIGNPIQSVDKFHLFGEANKVVDEVRQVSIWSLSMNFVKAEDAHKIGKKVGKNLDKMDIQVLNDNQDSEKKKAMQKYKDKVDMRLNAESINKNALVNSKGETVVYNEITPAYFIETGYRQLFMYREKNLSGIQKLRLNQIFQEYDYLGFMQTARILKEDFMDAMDNLDLKTIDRIMQECLDNEHYRMKQFGRTIQRWYAGIKGFCEHSTPCFKFTNAFTEAINNLCKVTKRQSHGFKLKTMYLKKLVARFCLQNLQI